MGGINSITFTARHPERVKALVIVDVSPEIQTRGVENIRNFIQAKDELDSFEEFVQRAHRFNPRRSLENIRSRLLEHGASFWTDTSWHAWLSWIRPPGYSAPED